MFSRLNGCWFGVLCTATVRLAAVAARTEHGVDDRDSHFSSSSWDDVHRLVGRDDSFRRKKRGRGRGRGRGRRELSFTKLAGDYEPMTMIVDEASIDLDQSLMEERLNDAGVDADVGDYSNLLSEMIYLEGVYTDVFAELEIRPALVKPLARGTPIYGGKTSSSSSSSLLGERDVSGSSYSDRHVGDRSIRFRYDVADLPPLDRRHRRRHRRVGCIVGSLPEDDPSVRLDGCLKADGNLTINDDTYAYAYDPNRHNTNGRALALLSERARTIMYDCESCRHRTYEKFRRYYGVYDYGHEFITSAFSGTATDRFLRGAADFGRSTQMGRAEAIKKGTVIMNVWMYVIRQMEHALDACQNDQGRSRGGDVRNDDDDDDTTRPAVRAWDEAVAFYTGSLQQNADETDAERGKLLYQTANDRCRDFRTCGREGKDDRGNSYVNGQIFRHFRAGQSLLLYDDDDDDRHDRCDAVRDHKEAIERLMIVPLVQGTLRYAHDADRRRRRRGGGGGGGGSDEEEEEEDEERVDAMGAVYAASVLPLVHDCHPDDARIIYDGTRLGRFRDEESEETTTTTTTTTTTGVDFLAVKRAFERNYDCMGIACRHVGGLWRDGSPRTSRPPDASPCDSSYSYSSGLYSSYEMILIGFCCVLLLLSAVLAYCGHRRRHNRSKKYNGECSNPHEHTNVFPMP